MVAALTAHMAHRGPDGCGFWSRERGMARFAGELPDAAAMVLGHRRLSIVDIGGGAQPMSNETGSVWISYNGEIYNAPELRRQLKAGGHVFRSAADTEVLVHGWEEWGVALFERLNGIFAFALYDTADGTVRLVRDPLGVKPLYVGASGARTWWASELRAAMRAGLVAGPWNREALKLYLLFRFVPAPSTLLEGVWKLPPSHYVELAPNRAGQRPEFVRYHTSVTSSAHPKRREEWAEALIQELDAAVERQLMADVPVGSLLSGGIDSSLVTRLMARHLATVPQTFAVGFESHGRQNEGVAARLAASELRVPLRTRLVRDDEYLEAWPRAVQAMSEPIGNASSLLLGYACRLAAATHKVVLTGQGADEPLGGYPRHVAERLHGLFRHAPRLSGFIAQRVLGSDSGPRLQRALRESDVSARFAAILGVLPPDEVDRLVPGGEPARTLACEAVRRWLPHDWEADSLNALLEVDARTSLADDLLIVADHYSMAESVELRVPFLDLRLFELMSRMPSEYKVSRSGRRKWLYRRAALRHLPPALASALGGHRHAWGKKVGFRTPVERWFAAGSTAFARGTWEGTLASLPHIDKRGADNLLASRSGDGTRLRNVLFSLTQWAAGG